jgi:peptide/nickel transport system substrate-binding protein
MRKRRAFAALLVASGLAIAACGGGDGGGTTGEESGGKSASSDGIVDGGTLHILDIAEGATNLDPQRIYTGADLGFLGSTIQRTLTSYKYAAGVEGSELVADLATDTGTASNDAKTWEFTLRDGVTFEDGSPIECKDIRYGVSRTWASDVTGDEGPLFALSFIDAPEDYPGPFTATEEQEAGFNEAIECSEDGKTITFNLRESVGDFNFTVALLAFGPVPEDQDTGDQYTLKPVSSGPFKIESYEQGKELVMVRNENWNKDSDPIREPHLDKIIWHFGLGETVIDERMIADQGDDQAAIVYGGIQPQNLQTIFGDDKFKDRRTDGFDGFVTYTMVNMQTVNCAEIRRAIWLALDRDALRTAGGGPFTGEYAKGFINPRLGADYEEADLPEGLNEDGTPNVEAAQAEMDKAKENPDCADAYKRATETGLTRDHADSELWQKLIAIWIDSMDKIGIKIIDNPIEPSKYYATINETPGDLMSAGWAADWNNASTVIPPLFIKDGGFAYNYTWEDPEYDGFKALVDKAKVETDREKQGDMWKELNQWLVDRVWNIPGLYTKTQNIVGSRVRNAYQWYQFGWYNVGAIGLTE